MVCSQCGLENSPDKKFCTECGAKLTGVCPKCNMPIEGSEKFCGQCGRMLTSTMPSSKDTSPETPQSLQRYLPGELINDILNQWKRIEGEQRLVTFLICNISEATHPDREHDFPEDTFHRVRDIIVHKINDYKGTINKFDDSEIIGIYGAPLTIEDAPLRAVRSAWAIHREIHRFSQEITQDIKTSPLFDIKIGIHTGSIVLTALGPDMGVEFDETEDTMDTALDIVKFSETGTTYISETTFRYTEGFFRYEDLGRKKSEITEKDIRVFKMITPSCSSTDSDECLPQNMPFLTGNEQAKTSSANSTTDDESGRNETSYRSSHVCGTPWKTAAPSGSDSLHIKTRVSIFLLLFYLALIIFMAGEHFYPNSPLVHMTGVFDNYWANTILITSFLLVLSFILYWIFDFIYSNLIIGKIKKPKLGEMLLNEGYISDNELEEALAIQDRRFGDILLESGRLTREQLDQALEYQKQTSGKLGQILKKMEFSTDKDIDWALNKLNRKLGDILREKGLLSDYNLYWILRRQLYGAKQIDKN